MKDETPAGPGLVNSAGGRVPPKDTTSHRHAPHEPSAWLRAELDYAAARARHTGNKLIDRLNHPSGHGCARCGLHRGLQLFVVAHPDVVLLFELCPRHAAAEKAVSA